MESSKSKSTVSSSDPSLELDTSKFEKLTCRLLDSLGISEFEVSLSFVDRDEMKSLNTEYRQKKTATDVLSFPQRQWSKPIRVGESLVFNEPPVLPGDFLLGDVIISADVALQNAEKIGHSIEREVAFLIIHGILHLCGHDHCESEDEALMIEQQNILLSILENSEARPLWKDSLTLRRMH